MAPRPFNKYMVQIGMGTHHKFARLTDSEFRAHVVGVLAVAAAAPIRGYLLVGDLPAEPVDIAAVAGVSKQVAASAMRKLEAVGILRADAEVGAFQVHDWDDINPSPGAQRTRRWRDAKASPKASHERHAHVTEPSPEVEVEVEVPASTTSQQVARKRARPPIDQSKPPDDLPDELRPRVAAVLEVLQAIWDDCGGIEPQPRGVGLALMRNPRADHLAVAKRLQHWLLAGTGQRARCKDITARLGDWIAEEPASKPSGATPTADRVSELDHRRVGSMRALMNERGVA